MLPLKTILHPTDFSARSENAFRLASSLASAYGANLVIVHVAGVPLILSNTGILPGADVAHNDLREKLDDLEVGDDCVDVTRRLEQGSPATEILRMAAICHADLIVMGTHGRRGLPRFLMGSVAENVMRKAICPVVTVTTPIVERAPTLSLFRGEAVQS